MWAVRFQKVVIGGAVLTAVLLVALAASAAFSSLRDTEGHWVFGPGATPALAEIQPLPKGFAVTFDQTVHTRGSDNFNDRNLLVLPPISITRDRAISLMDTMLTGRGWKFTHGVGTRSGQPDCVFPGSPQQVFGAPATVVISDPNVPRGLRLAIGESRTNVVAVSLGEC